MAANIRASNARSACTERLTREREEADMAARERVMRGELALETYLTFYRGYPGKLISAMGTKSRKRDLRRRVH